MVHCTKIGVVIMKKIIILSTPAYFVNLGFSNEIVSDVSKCCPSASTLKNLMVELESNCILMTGKNSRKATITYGR